MPECEKCKRVIGGVMRGPGSPQLEEYLFPCHRCKILVNGLGKEVDRRLSKVFFSMMDAIKETGVNGDEREDLSGRAERLFESAWREKLFRSFTGDVIGGIILAAAEQEEVELDKSALSKAVHSSQEKIAKRKEQVLDMQKRLRKNV